jgi:hypothetical protein
MDERSVLSQELIWYIFVGKPNEIIQVIQNIPSLRVKAIPMDAERGVITANVKRVQLIVLPSNVESNLAMLYVYIVKEMHNASESNDSKLIR